MNRCHEVNSKIGCVNLLFPWWFWFLSTFCSKYSSRAPFSAQISYFTWCSIKGTIIGCISEEKKKVSSGHSKRQCPPVLKRLSLIIDNTCLQFRSVAQLCPTLCDPMNCSIPGLPVHHQLPEPTQTHVPWVGDAIQPSHPLSSPSPPALNLSQSQGLFQWVSSSHQVAKVLEFQLQHQSFQWIFRTDFL